MAEKDKPRPLPENLRKGYQPLGEGYIPIERRGYQPNESGSGEIIPPPPGAIAGDVNTPVSTSEPTQSDDSPQAETAPPAGEPAPNDGT